MSELLKKLQASTKVSANVGKSEDVAVIIMSINSITDERRARLTTDKGTFFIFKNQFAQGKLPYVGKGLKATLTLTEIKGQDGKEFINVTAINYNVDDLSAKQLVASMGNAVVLA